MRLMRMIARDEQDGSTVGVWLVPHRGMVLSHGRDGWAVEPTSWLTTRRCHDGDGERWFRQCRQWLADHGLDRAVFPTRRAAQHALEHALEHGLRPAPKLART